MTTTQAMDAATLARHQNQLRVFIEVVAGKPLTPCQTDLLNQLLNRAPVRPQ